MLTALLRLHPFSIVYAADLGAMLGREPHDDTLARLVSQFPGVTFWLDSGRSQLVGCPPGMRTVIGTETGVSVATVMELTRSGADFVLSLDFSAAAFLGDPDILRHPDCWPQDVIIMHLASVGTARGPAWPVVDDVIVQAGKRKFYVAGGVRDANDVAQAAARGIKGVLVATALHTGTLASFLFQQAKKTPV